MASYGGWSHESAWLWRVKDWIDRRFMRKFSELPEMDQEQAPQLAAGVADADAIRELSAIAPIIRKVQLRRMRSRRSACGSEPNRGEPSTTTCM